MRVWSVCGTTLSGADVIPSGKCAEETGSAISAPSASISAAHCKLHPCSRRGSACYVPIWSRSCLAALARIKLRSLTSLYSQRFDLAIIIVLTQPPAAAAAARLTRFEDSTARESFFWGVLSRERRAATSAPPRNAKQWNSSRIRNRHSSRTESCESSSWPVNETYSYNWSCQGLQDRRWLIYKWKQLRGKI